MAQVIAATVRIDNVDDHYDLYSYLRDSCTPAIRPLFNCLADHYDDKLKAAALVEHRVGHHVVYELVIWYGYAEVRFRAGIPRNPPTLDDFTTHLLKEPVS